MTLLDLAAHTSGLPRDPNNLTPTRGLPENAFADYSAERLYGFLRGFTLSRDPGRAVRSKTKCNESGRINETENPNMKFLPDVMDRAIPILGRSWTTIVSRNG